MGNAAELERKLQRNYPLDTRVAVLETKQQSQDENINNRFKNIENNLDKINTTISNLSNEMIGFIAASNARHKLWLFIFSLVGALTVILKVFGVDV
jgi:hypothetical protein